MRPTRKFQGLPLPVASDVGRGFVPSCYWHIDIGRNLGCSDMRACCSVNLSQNTAYTQMAAPEKNAWTYGLFDCCGDGGICEAHILNRDHSFPRMIPTDPSYTLSTRA